MPFSGAHRNESIAWILGFCLFWVAADVSTSAAAGKNPLNGLGPAYGRNPDFRNNRDAKGPTFPVGNVDSRLAIQEDVYGIVTKSGKAIAFPVESATASLLKGDAVIAENIRLILDGGGLRAVDAEGLDLGGHEAVWFAWSQFYPQTEIWRP
jgi:hypothetical protein